MAELELDFDNGDFTMEEAVADFLDTLPIVGVVTWTVVTMTGPAGGCPVVRFTAIYKDLLTIIGAYDVNLYGTDLEEELEQTYGVKKED